MDRESRVLVVDDEPAVRKVIEKHLLKNFPNMYVDVASCGEEALELAAHNHYNTILMDIMMPGMDGFEVFRHLQNLPTAQDVPVIFVTSFDNEDKEYEAYDLGSVDYLFKPIDIPQMLAKVRVHVKHSRLLRELKMYRDHMQNDIEKAQTFYQQFLPQQSDVQDLEENHKVKVFSIFEAYNKVGGDLWKIQDIDEDHFGILLVDFSGHGVSSALNAAYMNALLAAKDTPWGDVAALMTYLNDHLLDVLGLADFATATYALVNTKTGIVRYCNCGAPWPVYINCKKLTFLEKGTRPLGFFPSAEIDFEVGEQSFKSGDELILYSDALIEAKHEPDNKMWLHEGFEKALVECQEMKDDLSKFERLNNVFRQTVKEPIDDDLTVVGVKF